MRRRRIESCRMKRRRRSGVIEGKEGLGKKWDDKRTNRRNGMMRRTNRRSGVIRRTNRRSGMIRRTNRRSGMIRIANRRSGMVGIDKIKEVG